MDESTFRRSRKDLSVTKHSTNLIADQIQAAIFTRFYEYCCTVSFKKTPDTQYTTIILLFVIKVIRKRRVVLLDGPCAVNTMHTSTWERPLCTITILLHTILPHTVLVRRFFCRSTFLSRTATKVCRNGNRRSRFVLSQRRGIRERIYLRSCAFVRDINWH